MSISDTLREALLASGLTPYRLAKLAGTTPPVVTRFINGERDLRLATAAKLAEALGLELLAKAKRRGKGGAPVVPDAAAKAERERLTQARRLIHKAGRLIGQATRPKPPRAAERVTPAASEGPAAPDFAALFATAFDRLDDAAGAHNFTSLVELRQALTEYRVDRSTFDAGLAELRRAGLYTLAGAEGRHGVTDEEMDAGILEDGSLLLYVSRRV
jgi:transcriptional regulator with XRE-family HTH domain